MRLIGRIKSSDECGSSARSAGENGFTLIELMIVLVILGVLLVLAGPSFREAALNSRLKSYANEMLASIYLARGEAIKRNSPVRLCVADADGTDCAASGNWEQGWIVIDQDDRVLNSHEALAAGYRALDASAGSVLQLVFLPNGSVDPAADIKICRQEPEVGGQERVVVLNRSGRGRIDRSTEGVCP